MSIESIPTMCYTLDQQRCLLTSCIIDIFGQQKYVVNRILLLDLFIAKFNLFSAAADFIFFYLIKWSFRVSFIWKLHLPFCQLQVATGVKSPLINSSIKEFNCNYMWIKLFWFFCASSILQTQVPYFRLKSF